MADASNWKVGYYTPSSVGTLSFAQAKPGGGVASFTSPTSPTPPPARHDPRRLQRLDSRGPHGKTINRDLRHLRGHRRLHLLRPGNPSKPCGTPASTRLFFRPTTAAASLHALLVVRTRRLCARETGAYELTVTVEPAQWSDWTWSGVASLSQPLRRRSLHVKTIDFVWRRACFLRERGRHHRRQRHLQRSTASP